MKWFLVEEKQPGDTPKLHFELDYKVRPFVEVEQEYLEMFQKLSESSISFRCCASSSVRLLPINFL